MSEEVQKLYKSEQERLKKVYGGDVEDLSKFPSFNFKD